MSDRRYNEAEVAEIFRKATEAQHTSQQQLPSGEGLTLAELQEIGREVGISPDLVAQAGQLVARSGTPTSRKFLGLPIGVGYTIELGRKLSDDEWERLVVDLRETFDARGNVRRDGSLRQWTNGNLQALVEPSGEGHRVRLRTVKGDARGLMAAGIAMLSASAVGMGSALLQGATADLGMLSSFGVVLMSGATMFGVGALRLPGWARLRSRQMREVAERLAAATGSQSPNATE